MLLPGSNLSAVMVSTKERSPGVPGPLSHKTQIFVTRLSVSAVSGKGNQEKHDDTTIIAVFHMTNLCSTKISCKNNG